MKKWVEGFLRVLFALCVTGAVVFGAGFAYYATSKVESGSLPLQFSLKAGSGLRSAANQMERAGVLPHSEPFVIMARLLGEADRKSVV